MIHFNIFIEQHIYYVYYVYVKEFDSTEQVNALDLCTCLWNLKIFIFSFPDGM